MPPPDLIFIHRAIDLAMQGRGRVEPNPMVGCVIVKVGRVIGEGWHQQYGGPHAEPNALAACTESPQGATAYVTLEPCCHTNKQTPPCVPRLIDAAVARVVVGAVDPNPQVAGHGIEQLRGAGIDVVTGVLEAECRQLAAPFFVRVLHPRPYVTLKWAQSDDGKIAGPGGARLQISNAASTLAVHQLRARCDAILVGVNTVLSDDPLLTIRGTEPLRPLTRVVLDRSVRIPLDSRLVRTAAEGPVVVFADVQAAREQAAKADALRLAGVSLTLLSAGDDAGMLRDVLDRLARAGVTHLLVEPGPRLAGSFVAANLVDRLWVFRSPKRVDDAAAPQAAEIPADFVATGEVELNGDRLTEYLNPRSPVFFKTEPSADFLQVSRPAQQE